MNESLTKMLFSHIIWGELPFLPRLYDLTLGILDLSKVAENRDVWSIGGVGVLPLGTYLKKLWKFRDVPCPYGKNRYVLSASRD